MPVASAFSVHHSCESCSYWQTNGILADTFLNVFSISVSMILNMAMSVLCCGLGKAKMRVRGLFGHCDGKVKRTVGSNEKEKTPEESV